MAKRVQVTSRDPKIQSERSLDRSAISFSSSTSNEKVMGNPLKLLEGSLERRILSVLASLKLWPKDLFQGPLFKIFSGSSKYSLDL